MKTAIAVLLALLVSAGASVDAQEAGSTSSSRYSASPMCLWMMNASVHEIRMRCGPEITAAQRQHYQDAQRVLEDYMRNRGVPAAVFEQYMSRMRRTPDTGKALCDKPDVALMAQQFDAMATAEFVSQLPAYLQTRKGPDDGSCL